MVEFRSGAAVASLAVREPAPLATAFEPTSFDGLVAVCTTLFASRLLPRGVTSVEAAVYIGLRGRELGLSLGQAFASINVIDGKTVLSADLIAARVRRSGDCRRWQILKLTNEECTIAAQHAQDSEPTVLTWTIKDAERAGLLAKDNWRKYPRAMLRARCSAELARAVFPEVALGMYDPDELGLASPPEPVQFDVRPAPANSQSPVIEAVPEPPKTRPAKDVAREICGEMQRAATLEELKAILDRAKNIPFRPAMRQEVEAFAQLRSEQIARDAPQPPSPEAA